MMLREKIELQIMSYCLEGKNLKENEAVIDTNKIPLLSAQIISIVYEDIILNDEKRERISQTRLTKR